MSSNRFDAVQPSAPGRDRALQTLDEMPPVEIVQAGSVTGEGAVLGELPPLEWDDG